ncbi:MAG: hypothetical protein ACM359_03815 [Bacillota bacterium]
MRVSEQGEVLLVIGPDYGVGATIISMQPEQIDGIVRSLQKAKIEALQLQRK